MCNKYILSIRKCVLQVSNYEIIVNFFLISHNLTWYSAIVHKFIRIYPVCSTYELKKQFMYICVKNCAIDPKKNNLYLFSNIFHCTGVLSMVWPQLGHCTVVRFASFLSGGFIIALVFSKSTGKETGKLHICALYCLKNALRMMTSRCYLAIAHENYMTTAYILLLQK